MYLYLVGGDVEVYIYVLVVFAALSAIFIGV